MVWRELQSWAAYPNTVHHFLQGEAANVDCLPKAVVLRPLFCLIQCHWLNRGAVLHFEFKKSSSSLWVWNNRNCEKCFQASLDSAPLSASAHIHKNTRFWCGLSDLIFMWKQLPTCGVSPVSGIQSVLRQIHIYVSRRGALKKEIQNWIGFQNLRTRVLFPFSNFSTHTSLLDTSAV